MNEDSVTPGRKRNIWIRGLFMLLMFLAFHVSTTVLCIVAVIQFVMKLLSHTPNERLVMFGRSLGTILAADRRFPDFCHRGDAFPFQRLASH